MVIVMNVDQESGVTKRLKTGIPGLDRIIAGGIPINSQVLILGGPGTGKTLMTLEILYHNARLERPTTFITTEETAEDIIENATNAFYAFEDFSDLVDKKLIHIVHKPIIEEFKGRENFQKFVADDVIGVVNENKSSIVVFDSMSSLRPVMDSDRTYTRAITYMTEAFKSENITAFITAEATPERVLVSDTGLYGTSMFDGLIKLAVNQSNGSAQYLIEISKLRNSSHRLSNVPYQITSSGVNILAD